MDGCLLSSKKMNWGTPKEFFDELDKEFHFALDVAAGDQNHKCDRYFTEEQDGLSQDWVDLETNGAIWCNPPYGRQLGKWVEKAYLQHQKFGSTIVLLIPARTDTNYFHDYILGKAEIRFIRGRLYFEEPDHECSDRAPFPSMIVVYGDGYPYYNKDVKGYDFRFKPKPLSKEKLETLSRQLDFLSEE